MLLAERFSEEPETPDARASNHFGSMMPRLSAWIRAIEVLDASEDMKESS